MRTNKSSNTTEKDESASKRRKVASDSKKIENEKKHENWIVSDENYNSLKGNRDKLSKRPDFKGTKVCHRWFCRGYCFNNCSNISSHVSYNDLPSSVKKEMDNWVKDLSRN